MNVEHIGSLQTGLETLLPDVEGLVLIAGQVEDHMSHLSSAVRAPMQRAVQKRRNEYSTGRYLAGIGLERTGIGAAPIERDEQRRPIWPDGVTGSITHTDDVAIAGVALQGSIRSCGIDLEEIDRVAEHLFEKLLTENEMQQLAKADKRTPAVIFSAKEAGYKATNPLIGEFIGFHEAEVDIDWANNRFDLRYVGDYEPNTVMEAGFGHFAFFGPYVFSLFIIPR